MSAAAAAAVAVAAAAGGGGLRRVVVTGAGLVTPLGCGTESIWQRLLRGECGLVRVADSPECQGLVVPDGTQVRVLARVPRAHGANGAEGAEGAEDLRFDEKRVFGRGVSKEMSEFTQFAVAAADLALRHARFPKLATASAPETAVANGTSVYGPDRVGVTLASGGSGAVRDIIVGQETLAQSFRKTSPYFIPKILGSMAASQISIRFGFQGPVHSVATACAAGSHSIGDAYNFVRLGYADAMLAGGADASIDPLSLAGFARMKALSTRSDPLFASTPFDASRDGFVMGEGAGVLVLEELESALRRGAPILAEMVGYAATGDAYHATSPAPFERGGAQRGLRQVLSFSGLQPDDVGYINAHATSTPLGDGIEVDAIDSVFSSSSRRAPLYVSSTKGATGHLLGAAGAVEAAFTVLALRDGQLPPTLGLNQPDPAPKSFHHIPHKTIAYPELKYAINNSFGFGGTNAMLAFAKFPRD